MTLIPAIRSIGTALLVITYLNSGVHPEGEGESKPGEVEVAVTDWSMTPAGNDLRRVIAEQEQDDTLQRSAEPVEELCQYLNPTDLYFPLALASLKENKSRGQNWLEPDDQDDLEEVLELLVSDSLAPSGL